MVTEWEGRRIEGVEKATLARVTGLGWVGLGRKGALNKRRKPAATSFQGEEEYE